MRRVAAIAALLLVSSAGAARAQGAPPPGRFEIGGGVNWMGNGTLGSADANETTSGGGTSRLFSTSSELAAAGGFEVHLGFGVTRKLELTAGATYGKPSIRTTIANDTENSTAVTATEQIKQYGFSGGALWSVGTGRDAKVFPFVAGSVGYLRQLHEADTLAATGQIYTLGGGAKYFFASGKPSRRKGFGLRGDAAVVIRRKGVAFGDRTLYSPLLGASAFVRF